MELITKKSIGFVKKRKGKAKIQAHTPLHTPHMGLENAGQVHTAPYGGAYEAPIVSTEAATPLHTPRMEGRMDPP